jgi:hypothetical protein
MKKVISPILLLLFIFCASCDNNPTAPNLASSYFPLSMGNKWYYRQYYTSYKDSIIYVYPDLEYDISSEIVGTTTINGENCSISRDETIHYSTHFIDITYYRIEGDKLYRYKIYYPYELVGGLLVDFSIAQGDTFHCNVYGLDYIGKVIEKNLLYFKIHYYIPGAGD